MAKNYHLFSFKIIFNPLKLKFRVNKIKIKIEL